MTNATFTATFTTAGTFTWVAPAGVSAVSVECWGSGGGGGHFSTSTGGGGGGGGEYAAELSGTCTAGNSYTVVVGAGGGDHAAGNSSSFTGTGTTTVTAHGGGAGANGGSGGSGGTGSTNSVHHDGGAGGAGGAGGLDGGGGGGGSGGTSAAGNTGTAGTSGGAGSGATAVTGGGPGGNGSTGSTGSSPATPPGGGGGGCAGVGSGGGTGAVGKVVITWTMASPATIAANTSGGAYTWTAPSGTTAVSSECWAAGGGGGGASGGSPSNSGAGGGGGEYAAELSNTCTAGNIYTIVVGAAGTAAGNANGGTGGNSSFTGTGATTVTAHGGGGGTKTSATVGTGGTGSTNTAHHDGGAGGAGNTTGGGGGGGSSGGSGASGNSGGAGTTSGGAGGTAGSAVTNGGIGGVGGTDVGGSHAGNAPVSGPGGGGGGASFGNGISGGAGFDGQIKIAWTSGPTTSGSVNVKKPQLAGTAFKGTPTSGSVNVKKPRLAGTEVRGNVTSGSVRAKKPAISGHVSTGPFGGVGVKKPQLAGTVKVGRVVSGGANVKKPRLAGSALKGTVLSGSARVKKPQLAGSERETFTAHGGLELAKPSLTGAALVQTPFPPGPLGLRFELLVGATWTDITQYVYQRSDVVITRGRPDETQTSSPSTMTLTLDNRDGRFSPRNPLGPYYGQIGRNTQIRCAAPLSGIPPWTRGYRFWGEVSEWPPGWDPTGSDVYVNVTAAGIMRRLSQAAALRSALYRYYSTLTGGDIPLAYWPAEDGANATSLATGIPGGFSMNFTGNPSLASDTGFATAAAVPAFNSAIFTGATGIAGALPVATTVVFSSAGSSHWTAPAGVLSVIAECWGAGGGGSGYNGSTGGAGGGGGEYASASVAVTPGGSYAYTVGSSSAGANGGSSTFAGDSVTVTAHGGSRGSTDGATGGAGGTGSSATTHFDGGAGAAGSGGPGGSGTSDSGTLSQTFTSSGTWTAPSDIVGNAQVYLWGAGGGGGAGSSSHGGAAGGGGGFVSASVSASPGSNHTVVVGTGGTAGSSGTSSTDGGASTFDGAHAASGGLRGTTSTAGGGGAGATHVGGSGGSSASSTVGAGGGGCASLGGNGQNGQNGGSGGGGGNGGAAGGLDTTGGAGGDGGTSGSKTGKSGQAPGGGGGGFGTSNAGGSGARGKVEVFWNFNDPGPTPDAAVGGGGGSSAGTGSAGNNGDTEAGGAAVTGGGPGGGTLAGSSYNASPVSGPGGGGGGYDSLGAARAGYSGQVRLTYAPSGVVVSGGSAANILRFLVHIPDGGAEDGSVVARMFTTGTIAWIDVVYNTGGTLTLNALTAAGATLFTSGAVAFSADGQYLLVSAELVTSGSNIAWTFTGVAAGQDAARATATGTLTSATVGDPFSVVMNPGGTLTATSFGHVAVLESAAPIADLIAPVAAHAGETAADRVTRLCDEEGVPSNIVGTASDTALMGPQLPAQLLALLQECEDADRGLLFEPRDQFGISYRTRVDLYNQSPAVTLIYTNQDLAQPLAPTDDDQRTRNDVTVSRPQGSSAQSVLTTGPLSSADPPGGVGAYTYSATINVQADGQLADLAGWILSVGTVDEPRYPVIALDLSRTELADNFDSVTAADLGDYLTIQNMPFWLPPGPARQLMFGYTENLNAFIWTISANCVPEIPYEIAVAYDTGAGTGARADTDGSSLHDGIGTGDTSFTVTSPSPNAPWADSTGYAAEFPFDVIIAGEQMTVTAISGTGANQTFTVTRQVNGISKAHSAGEPVALFAPAITPL